MFKIENVSEGPTEQQLTEELSQLSGQALRNAIAERWQVDPLIVTFDVLRTVINTAPEGGFDYKELNRVVKMTERLTGPVFKTVELAPDDWSYLVTRLKAFRWRIAHQRIISLIYRVENAERVTEVL